MNTGIALFFFLVITFQSFAQNAIGIPDIINYTKETYSAGTQNRGVVQDKNGVFYFANYEGVLSFDGAYWKTYPLPNKTIVRSVAIGKDNKLYAGGQNDFGSFSPDKNGELTFTSLKGLLSQEDFSFTDIWNIVPYGNDVFFRSKEKIFQLKNNSMTVYPAPTEWEFLGQSNNQLIAQDLKSGVFRMQDGGWAPFLKLSVLPQDSRITCAFPFGKDSSLVVTLNTGFYLLSNDTISKFQFAGLNPFESQRILTAIPVNKDLIAVGTNLQGCYIINKKGQIIQNLSRKEGLQINNVLCLFLDKDNNLWMGLDNGIDFIAFNNAIKHIYPEKLNEGEGYTSLVYGNELYIGTSNGLYWVNISPKEDLSFVNGEFQSVPNTKGSAWNLAEMNGKILLGHHDGVFQIKNNVAIPINKRTAYLTFLPFSNVLPSSLVLAGNEMGLDILEYQNNAFVSKGNLPNFSEYSQFVAIADNNTIWVAHPYRGVYKINIIDRTHPTIKLYTNKNGLPFSIKNHLFKVKNRIVVATVKGIYEYNDKKDLFEISEYFKNLFGQRNIRHLKEDSAGNLWFIEDKNLGIVDFSAPKPESIYFPELKGEMVSGFEHINPYNKFNVFVGAEKGFYHINYEQYKKSHYQLSVKIRTVKAFGKSDSLLFGGYFGEVNETVNQPNEAFPGIGHNWNSFHFEYASSLYGPLNNTVEYSYYLKGFDQNWSVWSKKTEKEYTNLPAGNYAFQIKAKNNLGNESTVSSYLFAVLPPWYQTMWANLAFIILIIVILYLVYLWLKKIFLEQQKKHEEEQKQLQYLHQLELDKSDKEIIKLKNEKLEAEIEFKNSELASTAMHLVEKGELLTEIKEKLINLKKDAGVGNTSDDLRKLIRILNEEDKMDKDWEQFAVHFNTTQNYFLSSLKEAYPNLSPNELKLSAYLRLNLSSKEIAQLMKISVRGVEIGRYRLRKKLEITTEANLVDFLLRISIPKGK